MLGAGDSMPVLDGGDSNEKRRRTMKPNPKTEIDRALHDANRITGWNLRKVPVRRFRLGDCTLIVVPARRWAYQRWERLTAERRRQHGGNAA